jgi:hypothetical protein
MNIIQQRILEQGRRKLDTRPRSFFRCIKWSSENCSGAITDETGFRFLVVEADLDPTCDGHLEPGERVSGIVDGPQISNILVESGPRSVEILRERPEFESVGPAPDVRGWDPHRGTPGIGHIRLGK